MRDLILVLEIGTLHIRVLAVSRMLEIVESAVCGIMVQYPHSGWIEKNADEIWLASLKTMQNVVRSLGEERFACLAIVNQRDTVVLWERTSGRPIYPVIGSEDRRTYNICDVLKNNRMGSMIHYRTGLFLEPRHPATKIAWILDHVSDARAQARKGELACGTLGTWIVWNLTRGNTHAIDISNASHTLLYDIHSHHWEPQLLATFGVPAAILPEVRPTSASYGQTVATVTGFSLPIMALATTPSAALYAQEDNLPDSIRLHCGKNFILHQSTACEPLPSSYLQTSIAWQTEEKVVYAYEMPVMPGGSVIQWLKDGLGIVSNYDQTEHEAESLQDTGGVYFVPALAGLGAPKAFADGGTIMGISYKTTSKHLVRAALEGIAHQVADSILALTKATGSNIRLLRADGGAAVNNFLMQFMADILGLAIERSRQSHVPALGVALWAGTQVNLWDTETGKPKAWLVERRFEPTMTEKEREKQRSQWRAAIARAKAWRLPKESPA